MLLMLQVKLFKQENSLALFFASPAEEDPLHMAIFSNIVSI